MANGFFRWTLHGAALVALTTTAGCSGPAPHETAPPPSAYREAPPPALMGEAPSSADHSGLAGGPAGSEPAALSHSPNSNPRYLMRLVTYRRADGVLVTAMRPVPNPEDLSADDRRSIYGTRYAPRAFLAAGHGRRHVEVAAAPQMTAKPAMAKAAPPKAAPFKPVAVAKLAPPPVAAAAPPPKAVEQARPAPAPATEVAALKTPPPVAMAPGLKAPADPKLAALQAALGAEVTAGSKLTTPDLLPAGQASPISLSLPQTLMAGLQREAAKLGLGKAARKAEVTATLSGQGYEITPNGPQTAQLKAGEGPSFNWQVKPGAGEKGPLRADVDATLKGLRLPLNFSLASLEQAVKAAPPPPPVAKGSWMDVLSIPGLRDVDVPGLGKVASKSIVGGVLVLLALLILISMARGAGSRADREERRRKFRTMTDYGAKPLEPTFDDEAHTPHYTAPLAPAAVAAIAAHEAPAEAAHPPAEVIHDAVIEPAEVEAATKAHAEPVAEPAAHHPAEPAHTQVVHHAVIHHDLTAPIALAPAGAPAEDDYGLSQVVREGRPAPDAHRELEHT